MCSRSNSTCWRITTWWGKVQQESEYLEDSYDMKVEFDANNTKQPPMIDEVEKLDLMLLPIEQERFVSFIPSIDFIIPEAFNMVEQNTYLFLM